MIISKSEPRAKYYRNFITNLDFGIFEAIFPNIFTENDLDHLEEYFKLFIKGRRKTAFRNEK